MISTKKKLLKESKSVKSKKNISNLIWNLKEKYHEIKTKIIIKIISKNYNSHGFSFVTLEFLLLHISVVTTRTN
jgi:hypothetical protein